MSSDLERHLSRFALLLRETWEQLGAFAWVVFGVILILAISVGILVLRWIFQGGLKDGAARRFLAERRAVQDWSSK
jgi:hypothetical protein